MSALAPPLRRVGEGVAVAALALLFYAWLSVRPDFIGSLSDAAIYVTLSDFFSPWRDAPPDLGLALLREYAFPPLYPLLLALLGGGSEHPLASHVAQSVMMALALAAVHLWFRAQACSVPTAMALTLLFGLLPASLLCALDLQSEPLYIALIFTGLTLHGSGRGSRGRAAAGALVIGCAMLARTAGIAAVLAVLVRWLADGGRRRAWAVPLLVLAPSGGWLAIRSIGGASASYLDSVRQDSLAGTLLYLAEQGVTNAAAAWLALVHSIDLHGAAHVHAIVGAGLLLALLGWLRRLRRMELDSLYVAIYLLLIIAWPYPDHLRRFLYVLLPLFAFYGHDGLTLLTARAARPLRNGIFGTACALVVLAMAPSTLNMLEQIAAAEDGAGANFVRTPQWHLYDSAWRAAADMERVHDIMDAMRGIDEHVPAGACVSSTVYAYLPLYGRRLGRPLAGASASDAKLFAGLVDCPYVFMIAATQWPATDYPPMYPYERIGDRLEILEVSLWDRRAPSGAVLTMLAKVALHGDGARGRRLE